MKHTVTLIPGDGIGPEVSAAVKTIVAAAGAEIAWEEIPALAESERKSLNLAKSGVLDSIRRHRVALKGPLETAIAGGAPSINVGLRKALELYANLRPGVVESLKIITEKASTRVAQFAFEYARKFKRKKIHAVHKANIMKLSDGLFLKSVRKVAESFPQIEYKEMIVDNACMQMVLNPRQFDMLLLTNLYGDIMSDLAAGLVGGLGVVPSGNIGDGVALFEAVHGTAPDIAGQGIANPTALLMSAIMMLDYLEEHEIARRTENALHLVYREGRSLTGDVGGKATTAEFTDAVIGALK
jgi:isocitrate dehydrogenase (NAD+)